MVDLSKYELEALRADGELILYRGRSQDDNAQVLVLSGIGQHPSPESLKRLDNECSLKEELDLSWAARPIGIATHRDRKVLVLQDPGGVALSRLLGSGSDASSDSSALAARLSSPKSYGATGEAVAR